MRDYLAHIAHVDQCAAYRTANEMLGVIRSNAAYRACSLVARRSFHLQFPNRGEVHSASGECADLVGNLLRRWDSASYVAYFVNTATSALSALAIAGSASGSDPFRIRRHANAGYASR